MLWNILQCSGQSSSQLPSWFQNSRPGDRRKYWFSNEFTTELHRPFPSCKRLATIVTLIMTAIMNWIILGQENWPSSGHHLGSHRIRLEEAGIRLASASARICISAFKCEQLFPVLFGLSLGRRLPSMEGTLPRNNCIMQKVGTGSLPACYFWKQLQNDVASRAWFRWAMKKKNYRTFDVQCELVWSFSRHLYRLFLFVW